eukprot:14450792-Ditylum_brightwellii.AAC.1
MDCWTLQFVVIGMLAFVGDGEDTGKGDFSASSLSKCISEVDVPTDSSSEAGDWSLLDRGKRVLPWIREELQSGCYLGLVRKCGGVEGKVDISSGEVVST